MIRYILIAVLALSTVGSAAATVYADTAAPVVKAEKCVSGDRKGCAKKEGCKDKETCKSKKTAGSEKKACCAHKKEKKA